MTASTNH